MLLTLTQSTYLCVQSPYVYLIITTGKARTSILTVSGHADFGVSRVRFNFYMLT